MAFFDRFRARPRGIRPELPSAAPGTSMYPGLGQWGDIPLPNPSSTTVLGLPAAGRAVNMIANAVAQMSPMELWDSEGFRLDKAPSICTRPNVTFGCFDFFAMATQVAVVHGNFCGIKADFDPNGYPQQVVPVQNGMFYCYFDQAGYLVYSINGRLYSRDEVVHIRANAAPAQPMGVGVVTQYRRAIGQALDQQNFAADTYRSGTVPAGVIHLDLPEVDDTQATSVQTQWLTNRGGGRAPAVLPKTMTFEPLAWSPEDLQFLQARQFTVAEIAHMFNLDPTDLGAALAGSSLTYANIEQKQQQRIVDTYAPWMRRFEEEWTDMLPGANTAKMNPDNLLRTDSKTRAEVHQLNIATEIESVDEARKSEGRKPLPPPPAPPALLPGTPPVPGAPGAVGTADAPLVAGAPTPVAGDPNIQATPVKIKI